MATYQQIYGLMNDVTALMTGETQFTTAVDTNSFVSLGKQVLSTSSNVEQFYQKLPDVIGRIVCRYQQIKRRTRDIQVEPLDFGIAIQEIEIGKIARAKSNRSWYTTREIDPFAITDTTSVNEPGSSPAAPYPNPNTGGAEQYSDDTDLIVNIISRIAGWETEKIIYDNQLFTAFQNEGQMAAFVNMIFNDMYNGMINCLNNAEAECEATAIGQELYAKTTNGTKTAVNLLADYITETGDSTVDATNWQFSADFLKYANYRITNDIKNATQVSALYTPGSTAANPIERELGDFKIHVLTDFANASRFYLLADTYNANFVELGGYSEIVCWQGRKGASTADTFADKANIKIKADFDGSGDLTHAANTQSVSGVVAHVFADGRMLSMIDRIRTKSQYNPIGERTTYAHKADVGYAVRPTEIGITYYIAS